jgi:hypothetical protein
VNSLSCIPPSLAELPLRRKTSLLLGLYEFLLRAGFSLKEIGDHLGHRDVEATRVYAKVDLVRLREVADFDLGELL